MLYLRVATAWERQNQLNELEVVTRRFFSSEMGKLGIELEDIVENRLDLVMALRGLERFVDAINSQLEDVALHQRDNGTGDSQTSRGLRALRSDCCDDSHFRNSMIKLLMQWRKKLF